MDHRADIYSLGVVFYEMLTGELPIGRFSPPSKRTPLDPRLDEVVMRALEQLRSSVDQALKQKTVRLAPGDQKLLFEFGSSSDTALKAWIKVIPRQ